MFKFIASFYKKKKKKTANYFAIKTDEEKVRDTPRKNCCLNFFVLKKNLLRVVFARIRESSLKDLKKKKNVYRRIAQGFTELLYLRGLRKYKKKIKIYK